MVNGILNFTKRIVGLFVECVLDNIPFFFFDKIDSEKFMNVKHWITLVTEEIIDQHTKDYDTVESLMLSFIVILETGMFHLHPCEFWPVTRVISKVVTSNDFKPESLWKQISEIKMGINTVAMTHQFKGSA